MSILSEPCDVHLPAYALRPGYVIAVEGRRLLFTQFCTRGLDGRGDATRGHIYLQTQDADQLRQLDVSFGALFRVVAKPVALSPRTLPVPV